MRRIEDPCSECAADIDRDGEVGGFDLAFVLGAWGQPELFPGADLNRDGTVNGADLAQLLGVWGPCP